MRLLHCYLAAILLFLASCGDAGKTTTTVSTDGIKVHIDMDTTDTGATPCSPGCEAEGETGTLTCNLTSPELRKRKETVLASLKKQVVEKKELTNGYAFRFKGSDAIIDELTEFVKTERQCCSFFTFNISFGKENGDAWLELKGPDGAKDFITDEMGL